MPATHDATDQPRTEIPCLCGQWTWYELALTLTVAMHERFCPRCRKRYLLLLRSGHAALVVPLRGRDLGSLWEALSRITGLAESERQALLELARKRVAGALA